MIVEPPMGPRAEGDVIANGSSVVPDFWCCESCGSVVRLVPLTDGSVTVADYAVRRAPEAGMVAFNPRTRKGFLLGDEDVEPARGWMAKGIAVYRPHELTCIRPGGNQLELGG